MPLAEKVTFTAPLQKGNTFQVPRLVRGRFKMEHDQALRVGVNFLELHKGWQFFYKEMRKDGRITVPKNVLHLFSGERANLVGLDVEVMIEPA